MGIGNIIFFGFSVFSMFFGSGNLIYPIEVGSSSGHYWLVSYLGFFCTAIILPFLGMFVVKTYDGSYENFFGQAGKLARVILPLLLLSLLGSFGVVPRCIVVAYGGYAGLIPVSKFEFSLIFGALCLIFSYRNQLMFQFIGKIVTPLLLIFILALIYKAISYNSETLIAQTLLEDQYTARQVRGLFYDGFIHGYNTMDLLAAFFFSGFLFQNLKLKYLQDNKMKEIENNKDFIIYALKPSLFGALVLSIVYLGFTYLGAKFTPIIDLQKPEFSLGVISKEILGETGVIIISIIIFFSCLTTAVALNKIYASYLQRLFNIEEKYFIFILLITSFLSAAISNFDFTNITLFLKPILDILYPALIVLTIVSIIFKDKLFLKKILFYGIIIISISLKVLMYYSH